VTAGVALDRWSVVAGEVVGFEGLPADEAAVELLVGMGARFTRPRAPWVKPCGRAG
jgi:predicted methyltransferase